MLPIIKSGRIPPHPRMLCAQIRYKLTKLLASLQSLNATPCIRPKPHGFITMGQIPAGFGRSGCI